MKKLTSKELRPTVRIPPLDGDSFDLKSMHTRAYQAFQLALNVEDDRYHIFLIGSRRSGRDKLALSILEEHASKRPKPPDWIYVYNFKNPSSPRAIKLESHVGKQLVKDINNFIEVVRNAIKTAFESDIVISEKENIVKEFNRKREELLSELNRKASELGFILQPQPGGFNIIPIVAGEPLTPQKYAQLSEDMKKYIDEKRKKLEEHIAETLKKIAKLDKEMREKLEEYDKTLAKNTIKEHFNELLEKYKHIPELVEYLNELEEDILQNIRIFLVPTEETQQGPLDPFRKYRINLIVDNSNLEGAPVIYEKHPTYYNLIGRIEKEMFMGALLTDFNNITPGSFHLANGGYLLLDAYELLKDPFAYDALKRVLKNRKITIEDIGERFSLFSTKTLKPEPIPFNGKVILMGNALIYYLLYHLDPEFSEIFGIKADMEDELESTNEGLSRIVGYVQALQKSGHIKPLSQHALEEVVLYTMRLSGDRRKLSTELDSIKALLIEAQYFSKDSKTIEADHVRKAIKHRKFRDGKLEDKLRELIDRGIIIVSLEGSKVGVVNGLSVLELGGYTFGIPSRITATVGLGKPGIVDIEREVGLGGKIHTKAVMIIGGYLNETYGKEVPISLQARLTFEQNYSGVEGDSASVAELLAILSAISDIPIRQDVAITGSMNQKGEVQPVGGINEKIEGFFYTCKLRGLTGNQGVVIPARNMDNLILDDEVVQAVEENKFQIWAIEHVDEAIEILTGLKSKEFHAKVLDSLKTYHSKVKNKE